MDASARFSSRVIDQMISDIDEADGNEVFWVGRMLTMEISVGSSFPSGEALVWHLGARVVYN